MVMFIPVPMSMVNQTDMANTYGKTVARLKACS